jgi:outer membrane receptor protein involved in Fe transport
VSTPNCRSLLAGDSIRNVRPSRASALLPAVLVLFCGAVLAHAQEPVAASANPRQLDAFNVNDPAYKPSDQPAVPKAMVSKRPLKFDANFGIPSLAPYVVTASRTPQTPETVSTSVKIFDGDTIRQTPALTLDGAFRSLPAFSLFRRSDSLSANPTAQGVSLRGLGPSGASRSLVLYDGVPLNDPFGGWVSWSKLPREGLSRAELVPGGGSVAWGNAALGGVVQVFALPVRTEFVLLDEPPQPIQLATQGSIRMAATLGGFNTRSFEFAVTSPVVDEIVQLLGREFATDGFPLVAPERRGPIDVPAWSRHRWVQGRWRHYINKKLELMTTVRDFEEFRGNGTPYTHNGSREKFLSFALSGHPDATGHFSWTAVAYAQDQSFASTFSSVNATRTAETPASDQFAVPSTAFGAAWTSSWWTSGDAHTSFGFDARTVRGETRENFTFTAGNFTRQRIAGGKQAFTGLFALHERPLTKTLLASVGARLDDWRGSDGHRRETDRATGAVLRDDHYAGRDGTEFSPSAGLVWAPDKTWRVRASTQQAFRVPTLNELYRPFRQGTTVVETNPDLRTERNTGAEIGVEWKFFQVPAIPAPKPPPPAAKPNNKPVNTLTLGLTAFRNELRDAVGNVTLARGPGTFPLFGTLAAGGIGRQRLNVDRIRVQGLEFSATWHTSEVLSFNASALLNDPEVRRAAVAPTLAGNQVAQVPRHSASLGATWRAPGGITLTPRVRWIGRQFEDDENTLRLGEAVVADFGASRPMTKHLELFLTIENVGNARLETGRSADGVVNVGTPRLALGGLRGNW